MDGEPSEASAGLVRRLTSDELESLRADVAAGRTETALKGLDERGAASNLIRDQYAGRYPLELLQNANDAVASEGASGARVKFVLTAEALLVADEGAGFGFDQVRAICGLARSSKDPRKSVGYKGLGFKSVSEITDRPQIIAEGVCFCFDGAKVRRQVESIVGESLPADQRLPEYAFPFELQDDDLGGDTATVNGLIADGFRTVMRLPLRDSSERAVVERHLGETVVPRLLAFLDATESLELAGTAYDFHAQTVREDHEGFQELVLQSDERTEHFYVFRKVVPVADRSLVEALGGGWAEVESVRIAAAVPLDEGSEAEGGEPLHVYFPTEEHTGLPVILNADFQMELDRRRLGETVQAERYNRWLLNELASFVAVDVVPMLARTLDGIGALEAIAPRAPAVGWGEEVVDAVIAALADQEFIMCRDGRLRAPQDAWLVPDTVPDPMVLHRWLGDPDDVVVPDAERSRQVRALLSELLEVPEQSEESVLQLLEPPADGDVEAYYDMLRAWAEGSWSFRHGLGRARCVHLGDGTWVRPSDGPVFLPPRRGETDYPKDPTLPIAQLPEVDGLYDLLADAGVEPLTWRGLVLESLMPLLRDEATDESARDTAMATLRAYFERGRRGEAGDQEVREAAREALLPARDASGTERAA